MSFSRLTLASRSSFNAFVVAGLLAATSSVAVAQGTTAAPASGPAATTSAGPHEGRMARHDPAKMQAMIAKRQADLKAKLKISPAQEGSWAAFTAAMQPPAQGVRPSPEQRAEIDKLGTPERIDRMRALRTQRMTEMNAAMDKRGDATKALYAALAPEQQKVFDAEQKNMLGHRGHGGQGRHGGTAAQKG